MTGSILQQFLDCKQSVQKQFAILIDPDKMNQNQLLKTIDLANANDVNFFFVGGSLLLNDQLDQTVLTIKSNSQIPVILFPGNALQISKHADAIFFLSLISGRNPDLLIGQHVIAAPHLRESNVEVISTGYMVVDGGKPTSVSYMSNTQPIPADKDDVALCTALAGEMLGMKLIYMDAGSGAKNPISASMIAAVTKNISLPVIAGGGITTAEKAKAACHAGADVIVVGNAIEKDVSLVASISKAIKQSEKIA